MSFLETIMYSLILGLFSFLCGYLTITIPYNKSKHPMKVYCFENPCDYDLKKTVDENYLRDNAVSLVDGDTAVILFIENKS